MELEKLLKPIKYLDENVILRQYTKLGKEINIDEGKKKYYIGQGLSVSGGYIISEVNFLGNIGYIVHGLIGLNDIIYNWKGIFGSFKERDFFEEKVLDREKEFHKKYNSIVRLPTFLLGVGLVGKFGIDLVNSIVEKKQIEPTSGYYLMNGISYLSLASSMYLKETDEKLLDKVPLWKKAVEYIKEKVDSFNPIPKPIPFPAFKIAENQ